MVSFFKMTTASSYKSYYDYLRKAPTLWLWWPMPIFLVSTVIVSEPIFAPSTLGVKALFLGFIAFFLYLIFINIDRNFYLKRTVLNIKVWPSNALIETLQGTSELSIPCRMHLVPSYIKKRHETTFPRNTDLYEITTDSGKYYLSSRMSDFEKLLEQLQDLNTR